MVIANINGIKVPYNSNSRHLMANHDGKLRLAIFPFSPNDIRQYESDLKYFNIRLNSYVNMILSVLETRKVFLYNRVEEVDLSNKQVDDLYRGLRFFDRVRHRINHFEDN